MIVVGASWILFWALINVFKIELQVATLITGIIFILLGLVLGERLPRRF